MPSVDPRKTLTGLGAFVMPVALVKLAAFMLGTGGPVGAGAAIEAPAPAAAPIPVAAQTASWPPEVIAAVAYAQSLKDQPFGPSPMVALPALVNLQPDGPEPEVEPEPLPLAFDVVVQSIMTSPQGDLVLMNGRVHRVGDRVDGADWVVHEIDARTRMVRFRVEATGELIVRFVAPD